MDDTRRKSIERRTDLDWLRIAAFGILILFQVGMFYGPDAWEIKSRHQLAWLQVVLDWSAPWRLMLLFMISGAATALMLRRLSPRSVFVARSLFLLPPLLLAVTLVSPPQLYIKAVEQFGYTGGIAHFLSSYFGLGAPICRERRCLAMPGWEHLWFVAYLLVYTSALCMLAALRANRLLASAGQWLAASRRRLFLVPALYLGLVRIGLEHFFPETHEITHDWYLHAVFLSAFLAGFVLLIDPAAMQKFESLRWIALVVALVAYPLHSAYAWHYRDGSVIPIELKVVMAFDYSFDQWTWVVVAIGFASRHLRGRDGAVRRYLTEAVFPYYIAHQVVIVVAAHEITRLDLPVGLEALLLVGLCAAGCAVTFEVVRRVEWLRPWFGIRPLNRNRSGEVASPAIAESRRVVPPRSP